MHKYRALRGDDCWNVWQVRYGISWNVVCRCAEEQTAKVMADALGRGRAVSVTFGPDGLGYPLPDPPRRVDVDSDASSRLANVWHHLLR